MSATPRTAVRAWRHHLRRALGLEHNALCRSLDRARSRALLLGALGLAVAVLSGTAAALVELDSAQREATVAAAGLHRVDAVVLTTARRTGRGTTLSSAGYQAEAAWTDPSGQDRTGTIELTRPTKSGTTTRIWVSDTGRVSPAPASAADTAGQAVCVGLFTLGALSVLIASGLAVRLHRLARAAAAEWQNAWARLEPSWTGRSSGSPGTPDPRLG
ncbi:Rv1733c family protein [Kitasatospora sp. NPDC001664]